MAKKNNPSVDHVWDRVCVIFDKWVDLLQMHWIDLHLYRVDSRGDEDDDTAADTVTKWQYRHASIRVYTGTVANHSDEELEDILVHELAHVLIASMETAVPSKHTDRCEYAVENVARALLDAHRRTAGTT